MGSVANAYRDNLTMGELDIYNLPSEVLVKICSRLNFKDLCSLELVSKYFRSLIIEHQLYKHFIFSLPDINLFSSFNKEVINEISEEDDKAVVSRLYKSLLVQYYMPDYYHCKGSYQYYIQVF